MPGQITIIRDDPFAQGSALGKKLGPRGVEKATRDALKDKYLRPTLGAMSRQGLEAYVVARLETPPNFTLYPELQDIYPERLDHLRGVAEGAKVPLAAAAVMDYVLYRKEIDFWFNAFQIEREPGHCSGVILIGPDGTIGAHSAESTPHPARPKGYRDRRPRPRRHPPLKAGAITRNDITVVKPRTGYIESWGATNEMGVGCCAGTSCGVWLDEPIEDTWPIKNVPLLRFARDIPQLEELFRRYSLFNWGRGSMMWADIKGNAIAVEKSFRRIGIRRLTGPGAIWCTEGHFQTDEMSAYIRAKRLEYVARMGRSLGAGDLQYATDCAVRFTHIGELCDQPWGLGLDHIRRILADHAPFPRAVCRHGGPDTDSYDISITLAQSITDFTHNRHHGRTWVPWKKFCCEVEEGVGEYPRRPGG